MSTRLWKEDENSGKSGLQTNLRIFSLGKPRRRKEEWKRGAKLEWATFTTDAGCPPHQPPHYRVTSRSLDPKFVNLF